VSFDWRVAISAVRFEGGLELSALGIDWVVDMWLGTDTVRVQTNGRVVLSLSESAAVLRHCLAI